ncbi:DUF551 domain-containing protein [Acinetobacter baumannii]|uniref:DUF551 domain-containing protein n=1 Tax=Acinetobacter baumannii TaxID=470 RepID=UPI001360951E|nr:DUF551 domain-containing protein [Acinetobacter baumannii]ELB1533138.1 DUF551 domain-containing protein [Acinetobacter baumannii]CAA0184406.1 hypothetical protein AB901B6_01010 [Acinetobacter baumannii]
MFNEDEEKLAHENWYKINDPIAYKFYRDLSPEFETDFYTSEIAWLARAKAQAVPEWISVEDRMPESLRNVLVLLDANPAKNQNKMVAHFIPKFTEEYHGDDDWYDYDEERACGYVKEGWYANTAYISDEYGSYFLDEKVTHWMPLKEASESGAEG